MSKVNEAVKLIEKGHQGSAKEIAEEVGCSVGTVHAAHRLVNGSAKTRKKSPSKKRAKYRRIDTALPIQTFSREMGGEVTLTLTGRPLALAEFFGGVKHG